MMHCASRKYYGMRNPLFGVFLLKLAKINLYLGCPSEALQLLAEAQGVIEVTHGKQHSLYTEEFALLLQQCQAESARLTL
ncbi:hypothetical protein PR048_005897 [Dryococelus australis]|uniref:Uncharacterized protein n=1 Tax=Dryococelus australis TaxID=614101 RepID=A0ABQ9I9I6_9NEOP|nr:hypothetical protein PR048_005897 [Dryococelus australis]